MKTNQTSLVPCLQTQQRLFQAAERLLLSQGYRQTTLRTLALTAQVNLAAVNYHFGSKEGLLHALIRQRIDLLRERFLENLLEIEIGEQGGKATEVLRALAEAGLHKSSAGQGAMFQALLRLLADPDPDVRRACHEHGDWFYEQILELLQTTLPRLSATAVRCRFNFFLAALWQTTRMLSGQADPEDDRAALDHDTIRAELHGYLVREFEYAS